MASKHKALSAPPGFVDGTDCIDELLSEPGMAAAVENIHRGTAEMDRVYAEGLAEIRKAAGLTQEDLAKRLGKRQAAISRVESRGDVLLSTLGDYLAATGATEARVVVHINGVDVALPLERFRVVDS